MDIFRVHGCFASEVSSMSKRNKGNHGVYSLTCISRKCGRKFGVMWEGKAIGVISRAYWDGEEKGYGLGPLEKRFKLVTYPFTGCPWCGAWWCTGPLDAMAYPKVDQSELFPAFMRALNGRVMIAEDEVKELSALHSRKL